MEKVHLIPVPLGADGTSTLSVGNAPYPLGCLMAYARVHNDGALKAHIEFGRVTPLLESGIPAFLEGLDKHSPKVFLLSHYIWNFKQNEKFAREVKQRFPGCLVIIGGPHVPRRPAETGMFLAASPFDVAIKGEGELALAAVLEVIGESDRHGDWLHDIDLQHIPGVAFKDSDNQVIQGQGAVQPRNIEEFPSPYVTGEFDHWIEGADLAPVESNRGCPYGCTFCDWGGATMSKVRKIPLERVLADIEYAASKKISTIGVCDANFGMFERDVEIARFCVEMKEKYGYPKVFGYSNAKVAKPRLLEIMDILWEAGLTEQAQVAMQTVDENILDNIERSNIRTEEYEKMISFYHSKNMSIQSDIMIGLPGQTLETIKRDLQFVFDRKVLAITFLCQVMPNSPMADPEYMEKYKIKVDENNLVSSTYSFSEEEFWDIYYYVACYRFFIRTGIARHIFYVMQLDYGVKSSEFMDKWMRLASDDQEEFPLSKRFINEIIYKKPGFLRKQFAGLEWSNDEVKFIFDDPAPFYKEILGVYSKYFGVEPEPSVAETLIKSQTATVPNKTIKTPAVVEVPHDLPAYLRKLHDCYNIEKSRGELAPLSSYGPGKVEIYNESPRWTYQYNDPGFEIPTFSMKTNLDIR